MDIDMMKVECGCGVSFMVPKHFYTTHEAKNEKFYCPNGHVLCWDESEADKVRRERDRAIQRLAEKNSEIDDWRATVARLEGERKRLTRRVVAGVCPCCHRSFVALAKHMKTKHPTYAAEVVKIPAAS